MLLRAVFRSRPPEGSFLFDQSFLSPCRDPTEPFCHLGIIQIPVDPVHNDSALVIAVDDCKKSVFHIVLLFQKIKCF